MSDANSRDEAIFDGALQLPSDQRAGYLKAACGGDAELQRRVEGLLAAHDRSVGPLEQPVVTPPRSPTIMVSLPLSEKPGDKIGHYKILQQIGEGGCGVVYMAEQEEPVRRRVALKVIKLGMDTKQVIARFEAERQALALMEHPNIAKVLDAGATETGRPFFVMELVRGIKITEYCDQNNLNTRQRLELFSQVCRAIQHAHQKGIIHRDIKPSNILVTLHDGVPVPKVIDFGIAKATDQRLTDKTLFTQFEQFIGTPAYMSPEQAEMSGLDIDTRSDIYSLGVLLYELLTSRTPFDPKELMAEGLDAMRRTIREKEPPRPSTRLSTMMAGDLTAVAKQRRSEPPKLVHLVRGDLDWIVMKALEKDRTRRYETANGFATDIQRYLDSEPVLACPPSQMYRFQKLVRRNKLAFAAVSAVAASVVVGLGISTWMFFKEREAHQVAEAEAIRSQQVAQFLEDMIQGVGPSVANGRDTALLRDILDKTVQRLANDLKDQPEVQAELCNTIGEVYRALGQYEKAEQMHRGARAMQGKGAKGKRADVTKSLTDLAMVLWDQGKLRESESLLREVLAIRRKTLGNENRDVALALNNLGIVLRREGKLLESESNHREALAMQRQLSDMEPMAVATSLNNLGLVLREQGKLPDAEAAFREALAIARKNYGERHMIVALALDNLAFLLRDEGKLTEAEDLERQALEMQKKVMGPEHPSVATALNNLALVLNKQGKLAQAEAMHREALAMRRKALSPDHPEIASSLDNLALTLRDENKLAEAERLENEALKMRRKIFNEDSPAVAGSLNNLSLVLRSEGRFAEAEALGRASLAIHKRLPEGDNLGLASCYSNLGMTLREENNLAEAESSLREALGIRRKLLGDDSTVVTATVRELTDVLVREHKNDEAERVFSEILTPTTEHQAQFAGLVQARAEFLARQGRGPKPAPVASAQQTGE
jgi:serine/threonine protein kinase/Tfp pilus assembly protein PilF